MSISYECLWMLLERKGLSQKELADYCGISASVLSRMRKGEYVSLEVLDKICVYLNCDYGDIVTQHPSESILPKVSNEDEYSKVMARVRTALKGYMQKYKVTLIKLRERTSLSINTIRSFLAGESLSSASYLKLLRLGWGFQELLNAELKIGENMKRVPLKDGRVCDVEYIPAKKYFPLRKLFISI